MSRSGEGGGGLVTPDTSGDTSGEGERKNANMIVDGMCNTKAASYVVVVALLLFFAVCASQASNEKPVCSLGSPLSSCSHGLVVYLALVEC